MKTPSRASGNSGGEEDKGLGSGKITAGHQQQHQQHQQQQVKEDIGKERDKSTAGKQQQAAKGAAAKGLGRLSSSPLADKV